MSGDQRERVREILKGKESIKWIRMLEVTLRALVFCVIAAPSWAAPSETTLTSPRGEGAGQGGSAQGARARLRAGDVDQARISGKTSATPETQTPLDRLYRHDFFFDRSGEPQLHMQIQGGLEALELNLPRGRRLTLGSLQETTIKREKKSQWEISIKGARPGRARFWIGGDQLAANDRAEIERREAFWRDQGFNVRIFEAGSSRPAREKQPALDARRVLIAFSPKESREEAEAEAARLRDRDGRSYRVVSELIERPKGQIVLTEKGSGFTLESQGLISFTSGKLPLTFRWRGERRMISRGIKGSGYLTLDVEGRLTLVERMPAESLLELIVPAEIYTNSPGAALQAQAVTARGNLLMRAGLEHRSDPFHFKLQDFTRGRRAHRRTSAAVRKTRGQVLFDEEGRLLNTVYHSTCGGHTEAFHEVWGGRPQSSLLGVRDNALGDHHEVREARAAAFLSEPTPSFCEGYQRVFRWRARRTGAEVSAAINARQQIGPVSRIEVRRRGVSGRVLQVAYISTQGELLLSGEALNRQVLGKLKSGLWLVSREGGSDTGEPKAWIFRGGGFGHGVGLCQHGAIGMAKAGYAYPAILSHFYPESARRKLW
ncbi:MAG: SpoIID/LytB domain-containing protein [Myxococcota bacterium]|nr:SpoIID/LytB domain-containing protein [Myxococcota bacterium]